MKKTIVFLLSALLVLAAALSLAACNNGVGGSNDSVTRMTITLVAAGSSGAAVKEEVLGDETEYYTVSGYSFSEADAAIVSNAEADPNYYTDLYNGKRKGTEIRADEIVHGSHGCQSGGERIQTQSHHGKSRRYGR